MLVASIVGVDMRATMDIDTTVKALPLNEADVQRIIEEICNIPLEDNVSFQIKSTRTIMMKTFPSEVIVIVFFFFGSKFFITCGSCA